MILTVIGVLLFSSVSNAEFEHLVCKKSSDCVVAMNSCGGAKVVNKKYKSDYSIRTSARLEEVMNGLCCAHRNHLFLWRHS